MQYGEIDKQFNGQTSVKLKMQLQEEQIQKLSKQVYDQQQFINELRRDLKNHQDMLGGVEKERDHYKQICTGQNP